MKRAAASGWRRGERSRPGVIGGSLTIILVIAGSMVALADDKVRIKTVWEPSYPGPCLETGTAVGTEEWADYEPVTGTVYYNGRWVWEAASTEDVVFPAPGGLSYEVHCLRSRPKDPDELAVAGRIWKLTGTNPDGTAEISICKKTGWKYNTERDSYWGWHHEPEAWAPAPCGDGWYRAAGVYKMLEDTGSIDGWMPAPRPCEKDETPQVGFCQPWVLSTGQPHGGWHYFPQDQCHENPDLCDDPTDPL